MVATTMGGEAASGPAISGFDGAGSNVAIAGLVPHEGRIEIGGTVPADHRARAAAVQLIFQDPAAALDPRITVGDLVAEPLLIHGQGDAASRRARAEALFARVGLEPDHLDRYPHEFSGGQRQRICIARALALQPKLLIADESVSALDVSVQARVLALLGSLKREFGLATLFISHDMAVVENIADRIAVTYLGQIVKEGSGAQVISDPRHAYTRRLMAAVPVPDPDHVRPPRAALPAEIPSPVHPVGTGPQRVTLVEVEPGHRVASG